MDIWTSRWSRAARQWSNDELARYAPLFAGEVVNVSGWRDEDKQGRKYRDYFTRATSYTITNWRSDARGVQGQPGEIFLDLERPLPAELQRRFDVVFNHTVLEHVYECRLAFQNLCAMSRDVAIVVVPFLQPYHGEYGDYWRFSPLTMQRLFEENGFSMLRCSFNEHWLSAVYLFALGVRDRARWAHAFPEPVSLRSPLTGAWAGARALPRIRTSLRRRLGRRSGG